MEDNSKTREVPAILIGWDQETQQVALKFDSVHFQTWDFVLAVLDMARRQAEDKKKESLFNTMQNAAQNQALEKQIRRNLSR